MATVETAGRLILSDSNSEFTTIAQVPALNPEPPTPPTAPNLKFVPLPGGLARSNYWAIEDAREREKLPLYMTIPAATPEELTPANGYPKRKTFLNWHRSHGDNSGARYSALDQINRQNVTNLQVAWIYHSRDGSNNIQCNPIVVRDVMIVPTAGKFIVGVNAENGQELWRFKPEGRPAFRGLIYWPGNFSRANASCFVRVNISTL